MSINRLIKCLKRGYTLSWVVDCRNRKGDGCSDGQIVGDGILITVFYAQQDEVNMGRVVVGSSKDVDVDSGTNMSNCYVYFDL